MFDASTTQHKADENAAHLFACSHSKVAWQYSSCVFPGNLWVVFAQRAIELCCQATSLWLHGYTDDTFMTALLAHCNAGILYANQLFKTWRILSAEVWHIHSLTSLSKFKNSLCSDPL